VTPAIPLHGVILRNPLIGGRELWLNSPDLDAFSLFHQPRDTTISYAQLFRNGSIEAVDSHLLNFAPGKIPWPTLEREIAEQSAQYFDLLRRLDTRPPVAVMVSLLSVRGARIESERMQFPPTAQVDRNHLILPDVLAEDLNPDVPSLLRPIFDTLWQACGRDRSLSYDANGNFLQGFAR
jgi:hypothetical protein